MTRVLIDKTLSEVEVEDVQAMESVVRKVVRAFLPITAFELISVSLRSKRRKIGDSTNALPKRRGWLICLVDICPAQIVSKSNLTH